MSVRVNLLPRELEEVVQARRVNRISGLGFALVVVVLSAVSVLQWQQVQQAEEDRDFAQDRVHAAQRELAALEEYRELRDHHAARQELLASAMEREISWARILNDLSLSFPSDASLLSMTADAQEEEAGEGEIDPGSRVGQINTTGYSLERLAPGIEAVLVDFDGARGFFNSYLQTAASSEISDTEVTNFNGTIDLDEEAYTHRYADGLPPEVAE